LPEDIAAELLALVKNAPVIRQVQTENSVKRQPLTVRTIGEILEMSFDSSDLVLSNGYLAFGERTALCGMGGVGKSRPNNAACIILSVGRGVGKRGATTCNGCSFKPKIPAAACNLILSEC
jgi:hypothetical protein